jgi:cysteine desulfurase
MIYLDNNASTAPLPAVVEAMADALRETFANASSVHPAGQRSRHAVDVARERVAALICAERSEIVFTSGGTESANLAIRGALAAMPAGSVRRRIVTTAVEHACVVRVTQELSAAGFVVDVVGVDRDGRVSEDEFRRVVSDDTAIVSLIHANNETGVVLDVARLAAIAAERGAIVHVDAVQSVGKLPLRVKEWPVDLLSLSAHKLHGPAGVGALYIRGGVRVRPMLVGGGQEQGLRGGTENVAGIVGMGVAAEAAMRVIAAATVRMTVLRDRLEAKVCASLPRVIVVGARGDRVCNTSNFIVPGAAADMLLIRLGQEGFCVSSGAACDSGSIEPSHVLLAMGFDEREASSSIRVSTSRFTTEAEVDGFAAALVRMVGEVGARRG